MKYACLTLCAALIFLTACPDNSGPSKLLDQNGATGDAHTRVAAEVVHPTDGGGQADGTPLPGDNRAPTDVPAETIAPGDVVSPEETTEPEDIPVQEGTVGPEDVVKDLSLPDLSKEGKACLEVILCGQAAECPPFADPDCLAPCLEGASDTADWELSLVADCYQETCSGQVLEPDEVETCLWANCFAELYVCIGGDGDVGCEEQLICQAGCGDDDGGCLVDCLAQANEEAISLAYQLDATSTYAGFVAHLFECVQGDGGSSCGEMAVCLDECGILSGSGGQPGSDGAEAMGCTIDCVKQGSPTAKEMYLEAFSCGEQGPCPDHWMACIGGHGESSCAETMTCIMECGGLGGSENDPDNDCFSPCVAEASPEGMDGLLAYFECEQELCDGDMEYCPLGFLCLAECGGDGELSCAEVFQCSEECESAGGGQECFGLCIMQISPAGIPSLTNYLECITEKCPDSFEGCPNVGECWPLCQDGEP